MKVAERHMLARQRDVDATDVVAAGSAGEPLLRGGQQIGDRRFRLVEVPPAGGLVVGGEAAEEFLDCLQPAGPGADELDPCRFEGRGVGCRGERGGRVGPQ